MSAVLSSSVLTAPIGLIPDDPLYPAQFLESLKKDNARHGDENPVAVVILSGKNCEFHFSPSNFHFIEQIARTYRVYLRTGLALTDVPRGVEEAAQITGKKVSLLVVNGHSRGHANNRTSLRVGNEFLNKKNAFIINSRSLEETACVVLKGCYTADCGLLWNWFLGDSMRLQGSTNVASADRSFFIDGRVFVFDSVGKPIMKTFTKMGEENTGEWTPPFIELVV
jgi:hypothetical protein